MAGIINPLIRRVLPDAERLANRAAGGFMPENVYHGTFENISSFRPGNPRAAQGSNIYTSTNPEDSSLNYARADGPDVRFRLAEEAYQMAEDAGGNPDIAQAIFDSLSPQQRNFYGTPEAWMATNPDLVGVAKDFVTGQMPSKGIVMPLAIRPGKIMDLTDAPTQTMMSDLPEDADDAFVEHVRDMSDYLPLREGTPAGLRNTFNSLRYDDPDASVRDFQQGLRREPIMEAVDANDEFYNPTNEIFSRWASDLGFPTQKIDPQQEFGRMYADPMWRDTRHYITEPERLRSVNANFDPKERKSSDLLAGAGIIPTMSSPEQLEPTAEPSGVEDQGTIPNPLRPYTHTTSTVGPEMRDDRNFQLGGDQSYIPGQGTASAIPGGWRGAAYDAGRNMERGISPLAPNQSEPNQVHQMMTEILGNYMRRLSTNEPGDAVSSALLAAEMLPGGLGKGAGKIAGKLISPNLLRGAKRLPRSR